MFDSKKKKVIQELKAPGKPWILVILEYASKECPNVIDIVFKDNDINNQQEQEQVKLIVEKYTIERCV